MGATCSSFSHSNCSTESEPPELKSVPKLNSMDSLRGIFPQWDEVSLRCVILKCEGTEDVTVNHLLTWGNQDNDMQQKNKKHSSKWSSRSPTPLSVLPRRGYDLFMRTHLLRHTTPASNIISIQAAIKFLSQARAAKKVVAQRRLDIGCGSDVAYSSENKVIENRNVSDTCNSNSNMSNGDSPREDKIMDGLQLMKERLDFLKLRMVTMDDDGNCQFRAISYELYGTQCYHHVVRGKIIEHLRSNSDMFSFYVGEESDWAQYLQKMSSECTWGDELTITAASQVFNVNIHVITTEKLNWLLHYGDDDGDGGGGGRDISSKGENEEGGETAVTKKRDVFLLYISPIHYNVVAPPRPGVTNRN